jgi:spermidine/putrescine transport system substrate-binding protein
VIPSDYAVEILRDDELLEEIDPAEDLPNFRNIEPDFRSPFFDPGSSLRNTKGKAPEPKYTVPYQWGTTGIAYDSSQVGFEPQTWDDLARPEVRGRVALINDAREVLGAGLISTGHGKNDASPDALEDAKAWVESLEAVPVIADDPDAPLVDGSAVISIMYNGDAAQAIRENPDIRYVLPESGGIWFDNLAIPKDAPHNDAALAFMDYVLEPEPGAEITRFFGYSTPNEKALELLAERGDEEVDIEATNPPRDALQGLLLTKDVGPEGSARFDEAWEEVRP